MAHEAPQEMFGSLVAQPPQHDGMPGDANQFRVYSKVEWDAQRPRIEQLYSEGTLATTMAALGAVGFPVTERQLKRKVMGWGLRKNLKKDEKEAIVRQRAHAEAVGEQRVFSLHNPLNRQITLARLDRMVTRDKIAVDLDVVSIPKTPPDVTYHTVAQPIMLHDEPLPESKSIKELGEDSDEQAPSDYQALQHTSIALNGHTPLRNTSSDDDGKLLGEGIFRTKEAFLHEEIYVEDDSLLDHGYSSASGLNWNDESPLADAPTPYAGMLLDTKPISDDQDSPLLYDGVFPGSRPDPTDRLLPNDHMSTHNSTSADLGTLEYGSQHSAKIDLTSKSFLHKDHVGPCSDGRLSSREAARVHAQNMSRLTKQFSDVLISLGLDDEEQQLPAPKRKRKRATALFYYATPDNSKQIQFRASPRDRERLYALGFSLAKQPDDSVSMMLPPLFESPYMRDQELVDRQRVCEMDQIYGLDDIRTIDALYNLCLTFERQNRQRWIEFWYHRTAVASRRLLGDGHVDTINNFRHVAAGLASQNKLEEASQLLNHLESVAIYHLGTNQSLMFRIHRDQATLLFRAGRFAEAEIERKNLLEVSKEIYGISHHDTISITFHLCLCLTEQGKHMESKEILEDVIRVVTMKRKTWSAMCILQAKRLFYELLFKQGAIDEGERLLQEVHRELRILRPGIDPREDILW